MKMSNCRTYQMKDVVIFQKTTMDFGGLSNMAAGYSLNVNDIIIPTAEHLYQACRFPQHPQLQWDIISEPSPMKAKWIGRGNVEKTRSDWNQVRFAIMRWVLEVKLSQNWEAFGSLLRQTAGKSIVELTQKDKVWGAMKQGDSLIGVNALGRLLMDLREKYVLKDDYQRCVFPLEIADFKLCGQQIDMVCNDDFVAEIKWSLSQTVD